MDLTDEMQDVEESMAAKEYAKQEQNSTVMQIIELIALSLSIGLAFHLIIRWRKKLLEQQDRLAGDSTTDAPPPKKKKGKGR